MAKFIPDPTRINSEVICLLMARSYVLPALSHEPLPPLQLLFQLLLLPPQELPLLLHEGGGLTCGSMASQVPMTLALQVNPAGILQMTSYDFSSLKSRFADDGFCKVQPLQLTVAGALSTV